MPVVTVPTRHIENRPLVAHDPFGMSHIKLLVGEKQTDDDFSFSDLEIWHYDCGGVVAVGKAKRVDERISTSHPHIWGGEECYGTCKRCGSTATIKVGPNGTGSLTATACDGKERLVEKDAFVVGRR